MKKIVLFLVLSFFSTHTYASVVDARCASLNGYWPSGAWQKDGEQVKHISVNIKYGENEDGKAGHVELYTLGAVQKHFEGVCFAGGEIMITEKNPSVDEVELHGFIKNGHINFEGYDKNYFTHKLELKK